jgi:hypothetical protein
MKDVKHKSHVQAVSLLNIILILATVQESGLKSELTSNIGCHISQPFDIYVFKKPDS